MPPRGGRRIRCSGGCANYSFNPRPRVGKEASNVHPPMKSPRIIPTGVGKSTQPLPRMYAITDHPHGRGEKEGQRPPYYPYYRIIPTGVGKRKPCDTLYQVPADHPHGRGEKALASF